MNDSARRRSLLTVLAVGGLYLATGLVTAALAAGASLPQERLLWRLSAFAVSLLAFAGHVAQERLQRGRDARSTAGYAALAVAFGAFGLALLANVRDLGSAVGYRPTMLIALLAWPLLAAVPAFVVAVAAAAGLGLLRRGGPHDAA